MVKPNEWLFPVDGFFPGLSLIYTIPPFIKCLLPTLTIRGKKMRTLRNLSVPTGNILVVKGEEGLLELLSLGDYGKDVNIKCDALGLSREIGKVEHAPLLPLEEKWVITVSTQYGCSMGCTFCDVPHVGRGRNATVMDLIQQVETGLALHPEVLSTKRLNIHFARMGEPTWNTNVLSATQALIRRYWGQHNLHPVVSTMMPVRNPALDQFIHEWMYIKNEVLDGEAGLQLSINSTNEAERAVMFNHNAHSLEGIAGIMHGIVPQGRKITLNFALAGYQIDPSVLLSWFDPERYIIKLTPMHKTTEALAHGIKTEGDYTTYTPYKETEEALRAAGYDVLVFIASKYEDQSRITCGNAILSGTLPECPYEEAPV
jgi:23S rRNA (adenine2503-C2)-methyltransferase